MRRIITGFAFRLTKCLESALKPIFNIQDIFRIYYLPALN